MSEYQPARTLRDVFNAANPLLPLPSGDPRYVDCTEVRGNCTISRLRLTTGASARRGNARGRGWSFPSARPASRDWALHRNPQGVGWMHPVAVHRRRASEGA